MVLKTAFQTFRGRSRRNLFVVSIDGADSHPEQRIWAKLIQPLGRGNYDVGIVLKKPDALGFKGPVGPQCLQVPADPKVHLSASMAAWRTLTGLKPPSGALPGPDGR